MKELPQNIDAEMAVLGCAISNSEKVMPIILRHELKELEFCSHQTKVLYKYLLQMFKDGVHIDLLTVSDFLEKHRKMQIVGGDAYLMECVDKALVPAQVAHYIKILKECSKRRRTIEAANMILGEATAAEDVDRLINEAQEVFMGLNDYDHQEQTDEELLGELREKYETSMSTKVSGVPTGFDTLDQYLAGLRPGKGLIFASPPGQGKTTFMNNVAEHVLSTGGCPAIVSQEMDKSELVEIIAATRCNMSAYALKTGRVTGDQVEKVLQEAKQVLQDDILIFDKPSTIEEIVAWIIHAKHKGASLVIIDYLQCIMSSGKKESREREVGGWSNTIRATCKRLNLPYILLSQFSTRYRKENREPGGQDLRDSGSIEQDAYSIVLCYKDPEVEETLTHSSMEWPMIWKIDKNRGGPTGRLKTTFVRNRQRFENVESA